MAASRRSRRRGILRGERAPFRAASRSSWLERAVRGARSSFTVEFEIPSWNLKFHGEKLDSAVKSNFSG